MGLSVTILAPLKNRAEAATKCIDFLHKSSASPDQDMVLRIAKADIYTCMPK